MNLKKMLGLEEESPEKELEDIEFADEVLKTLYMDECFSIPEKDKNKYVIIGEKAVFYPPEEYYGKTLTSSSLINMMRKHEIVPITVGNFHIFTSWKKAKEEFGYAILWKYLFETYRIFPSFRGEGGKNERQE